MGACTCTYTRDEEKNCDGTHKVVKAVKEDLAEKLAANGFPHASEYVKNNQTTPRKNHAVSITRLDATFIGGNWFIDRCGAKRHVSTIN